MKIKIWVASDELFPDLSVYREDRGAMDVHEVPADIADRYIAARNEFLGARADLLRAIGDEESI